MFFLFWGQTKYKYNLKEQTLSFFKKQISKLFGVDPFIFIPIMFLEKEKIIWSYFALINSAKQNFLGVAPINFLALIYSLKVYLLMSCHICHWLSSLCYLDINLILIAYNHVKLLLSPG